jgi:hypothetical protein
MSVSNLTNTIWVINNTPTKPSAEINCSINFTSNGSNYTGILLPSSTVLWYQDVGISYKIDSQSSETIYTGSSGWNDEAYRIIKITGGTDVTNSSLISWLEANATQVQVDDLTNTKWVLESGVYTRPNFSYNINFTSNNSNFISFSGNYDVYGSHLKYDNSYVYERLNWANENYRIIDIVSGTDIANPDLIVWLTKNATYIFINDLTNTTWIFKEDLIWGEVQYAINFTSNNLSFKGIKYQVYSADIDRLIYIQNNDTELKVSEYDADMAAYWAWIDNAYKTIQISGGTDANNLFLIADLTKNADLQAPVIPTITYDLTQLQLSAGTHTIKVKARATGYRDSNFSNSVSYTIAPQSFSVTITISNESSLGDKQYFRVYDGQDDTGTLLFESNDQNGTQTPINVTCTSGYLNIVLITSAYADGGVTTSGGVTKQDTSANLSSAWDNVFVVSGNGTIAITYLDWDF